MNENKHLTVEGIKEILVIAARMNRQNKVSVPKALEELESYHE